MQGKKVKIQRIGAKSTLYFRNYAHHVSPKTVSKLINSAILANKCSYAETDKISCGEITLAFNPLKHSRRERRMLERKVSNTIKSCN